MRDYRGLTKAGKWVCGCNYHAGKPMKAFIIEPNITELHGINFVTDNFIEVIPESVGQATSIKDKNDKEAWQSDKIRIHDDDGFAIGDVVWNKKEGQWYWTAREIDRNCTTIFIGRGLALCRVLDANSRFKGEIIGNTSEG
jgi:hypothetical protein